MKKKIYGRLIFENLTFEILYADRGCFIMDINGISTRVLMQKVEVLGTEILTDCNKKILSIEELKKDYER